MGHPLFSFGSGVILKREPAIILQGIANPFFFARFLIPESTTVLYFCPHTLSFLSIICLPRDLIVFSSARLDLEQL